MIQGGSFEVDGELLGELHETTVECGGIEAVVTSKLLVVCQFIGAYADGDSSRADDERGGVAKKLAVADLEGCAFEQAEAEEIGAMEQGVEGGN